VTFSHNCWYNLFPVLPPLSLNGIFSAMYSHRCCSSEVVNCVRLSRKCQEGNQGGSKGTHSSPGRLPPGFL